jgi:hypothetical protein
MTVFRANLPSLTIPGFRKIKVPSTKFKIKFKKMAVPVFRVGTKTIKPKFKI